MEKIRTPKEQSSPIVEEAEARLESEKLLSSLSGFARLSPEQQRYLKSTLYIQQRAERGTDFARTEEVHPLLPGFKLYGNKTYVGLPPNSKDRFSGGTSDEYKRSQTQIIRDYCHQVAKELESRAQDSSREEPWIEAGSVKKFSDLLSLIDLAAEQHIPPFYVEVLRNGNSGTLIPTHTTIILGRDPKTDRYIAWEKSGNSLAFQLVDLEEVYKSYSYIPIWRMRPMQV